MMVCCAGRTMRLAVRRDKMADQTKNIARTVVAAEASFGGHTAGRWTEVG